MNFESLFVEAIRKNKDDELSTIGIDEYSVNEFLSKVYEIPQKKGEKRLISVSYPTPLVYAICCRNIKSVSKLIELGANITKEVNGWQPIHYAVLSHDIKIVRLLIDADSSLTNAKSKNGSTPLHFAISSNNYEMVSFLLSNGADVTATTNTLFTPFLMSMACNDIRIVKALIAFSSDIEAKDKDGQDFRDIAERHQKYEYIKYVNAILDNSQQPESKEDIIGTFETEECSDNEIIEKNTVDPSERLDSIEGKLKDIESKLN